MKLLNKKIIFGMLVFCIFLLTGCEPDDTRGLKILNCTRKTENIDNMKASLKYKIYHDGTYVRKTKSVEKITSNDRNTLIEYKNAYLNVFKNYKDIEYYDNDVTTSSDSVTSTTIINYDKVDYKKILEIEGDGGNIYEEDGKVKLSTLRELYEKYGATCDD